MQNKIIAAIAAYLNTKEVASEKWDGNIGYFPAKWPIEPSVIASEITAAIAPHLEVGTGWNDAPEWAEWRLDYSDGSHNFSKGYPSIVTTGVVSVEKRPA